ncbi:MAG: HD domain-containing protein [Candidatus Moraniibacteriota bacterium]|nr:MAG: HD domain-containing protein [Candidatus Moranbacteria bacterium]
MIYTMNIQKAIRFALKTHEVYQKQRRKGKDIPYIIHPLTVGFLLSQAQAREEVVIAGILHDTIEDSPDYKKVNKDLIAERFGEEVAFLVYSVTENDRNLSWDERKKEALEHIQTFSKDSLLVKSADVIANVSELLADIFKDGDVVFERFSVSKEKTLNHMRKTIASLLLQWKENPFFEDLLFLQKKLEDL